MPVASTGVSRMALWRRTLLLERLALSDASDVGDGALGKSAFFLASAREQADRPDVLGAGRIVDPQVGPAIIVIVHHEQDLLRRSGFSKYVHRFFTPSTVARRRLAKKKLLHREQ